MKTLQHQNDSPIIRSTRSSFSLLAIEEKSKSPRVRGQEQKNAEKSEWDKKKIVDRIIPVFFLSLSPHSHIED